MANILFSILIGIWEISVGLSPAWTLLRGAKWLISNREDQIKFLYRTPWKADWPDWWEVSANNSVGTYGVSGILDEYLERNESGTGPVEDCYGLQAVI